MLSHPLACSGLAAGVLLLAAALPAIADPPAAPAPAAPAEVSVRVLVKIPMRDGVRLNATLYLPPPPACPPSAAGEAPEARFPIIFRLSPYTPDAFHREALYL